MAKDVLRDEQIVDLWRANFAHCTADTMRFARALEEAILAAAEPAIRADERERCAKVCDVIEGGRFPTGEPAAGFAAECAETIRSLGAGSQEGDRG